MTLEVGNGRENGSERQTAPVVPGLDVVSCELDARDNADWHNAIGSSGNRDTRPLSSTASLWGSENNSDYLTLSPLFTELSTRPIPTTAMERQGILQSAPASVSGLIPNSLDQVNHAQIINDTGFFTSIGASAGGWDATATYDDHTGKLTAASAYRVQHGVETSASYDENLNLKNVTLSYQEIGPNGHQREISEHYDSSRTRTQSTISGQDTDSWGHNRSVLENYDGNNHLTGMWASYDANGMHINETYDVHRALTHLRVSQDVAADVLSPSFPPSSVTLYDGPPNSLPPTLAHQIHSKVKG